MKTTEKRVKKEKREMCTLAAVCRIINNKHSTQSLGGPENDHIMRFYFSVYGAVDMELLIFIHNFSTSNEDDNEMNGI